MQRAPSTATGLARITNRLVLPGRALFSLAILALGIETLIFARVTGHSLGPQYEVIPCLPWLPSNPWLGYGFGAIWVACGAALGSRGGLRAGAIALGSLLALCTLVLIVPKYAVELASISMRTVVFEPLTLACIALLLPGRDAIPRWLTLVCRALIALALVVFGVDHFLALQFIATLIPGWIPWHVFWVAFFGAAMVATGVSIGMGWLARWGAAGMGWMFGIWVITLHIPRVLGLYGIPGAPRDPEEWSSLFIAIGLWGGFWALARTERSGVAEQLGD